MTIVKLNLVTSTEPIRAPSLLPLSGTPQPAPYEVARIGVRSVREATVHIKTAIATRIVRRYGRPTFQAKIQLRHSWNPRHIYTAHNRGLAGIAQGRELIFVE